MGLPPTTGAVPSSEQGQLADALPFRNGFDRLNCSYDLEMHAAAGCHIPARCCNYEPTRGSLRGALAGKQKPWPLLLNGQGL